MRVDNQMGGFRAPTKLPSRQIRKSALRGSNPQTPDQAILTSLNFEMLHDDALRKGKDCHVDRYINLQKTTTGLAAKGVL
jgi:hypothetical protein